MKKYIVNQDLLDKIAQGDERVIESVGSYLESLYPSQYFNVFCAAAIGSKTASAEKADKLARKTAGLMWVRGLVPDFIDALAQILKNPENCPVGELEGYTAATSILIEEKIVRNGTLIKIAEAVADSIALLREQNSYDKIKVLHDFGKKVYYELPGSEGGTLPQIYMAVFELARSPNINGKCLHNITLSNMLRRINTGDPNMMRAMGSHMETIKKRIEIALANSQKPLSDGDLNLPKPPMARVPVKMPSAVSTISGIQNRLASGQRGN